MRNSDGGEFADVFSSEKKKKLTSIPACQKTLCAEKNSGYFDFMHLKLYAHINISYIYIKVVFYSYS